MGCAHSKNPGVSIVNSPSKHAPDAQDKSLSHHGPLSAANLPVISPAGLKFIDEAARLAAVRAVYPDLKATTDADPLLEDITKLMKSMFGVAICLVSLIDEEELKFIAKSDPFIDVCQRKGGFCSYCLDSDTPEVVVVDNALEDVRFSSHKFVCGPPYIKYYAGAPLVSSTGAVIGALCLIDFKTHQYPPSMYNILSNFAEMVTRQLERDRIQEVQMVAHKLNAELLRAVSVLDYPVLLVDTSKENWPICFSNNSFASNLGTFISRIYAILERKKLTRLVSQCNAGTDSQALANRTFYDTFVPIGKELSNPNEVRKYLEQAVNTGQRVTMMVTVKEPFKASELELVLRHAATDLLDGAVTAGIPSLADPEDEPIAPTRLSGTNIDTSISPFWLITPKKRSSTTTTTTGSKYTNASFSPTSNQSSVALASSLNYNEHRPEVFDNLKLGPLIGRGSYGRVFRAKWSGVSVAVKIIEAPLYTDGSGNNSVSVNAILEASLSKSLSHPNVIQTYEYTVVTMAQEEEEEERGTAAEEELVNECLDDEDDHDGKEQSKKLPALQQIWIIQQYCNRGTIYDAIERGWFRKSRDATADVDTSAIVVTAVEIASALSYMHNKGIVHGDLSGNNVLLNASAKDPRRFTAIVCDFGLSRVLSTDTVQTKTCGTISYMPPELLRDGTLTAAADVYALGVLCYEMVSSERAWHGRNPTQIMYDVTNERDCLEVPEDVYPKLKNLINSCLRYSYTERPSMHDVLTCLLLIQDELPPPVSTIVSGRKSMSEGPRVSLSS